MNAKMSHIDVLNNKLTTSIDDKMPIGLTSGKMGLCLYFNYLNRWLDMGKYDQVAEKLLDEVINDVSNTKDITFENGLAGIAIAISHLIKKKFLAGEINEILEEVDSCIFKKLAFLKQEEAKFSKSALLLLLYYLFIRYTEQTNYDEKYIFQELMICTIEIFQNNLSAIYFQEHFSFSAQNYQSPLFLAIFSKIYSLKIYNVRIDKIMKEIFKPILSTIPLLHANRLYLLWGLLCIRPYLPEYESEIVLSVQILIEKISIEHIMDVELKNQDVYINNGLPLVYFLLFYIKEKFSEYKIDFHPLLFFEKIKNSEAWNSLLRNEYYLYKHRGLYDGFPGAYLTMLHIKKHFI